MQWTDAIQAQESAYTAVVFRIDMQLCFSLLMQLADWQDCAENQRYSKSEYR